MASRWPKNPSPNLSASILANKHQDASALALGFTLCLKFHLRSPYTARDCFNQTYLSFPSPEQDWVLNLCPKMNNPRLSLGSSKLQNVVLRCLIWPRLFGQTLNLSQHLARKWDRRYKYYRRYESLKYSYVSTLTFQFHLGTTITTTTKHLVSLYYELNNRIFNNIFSFLFKDFT